MKFLMTRVKWQLCWLMLLAAISPAQQMQPPSPAGSAVASGNSSQASAPQAWTWEQVKDRFEINNPTLVAGKLNIDELKADEITAHLRPNPDFTLSTDGTQITPSRGVWQPFAGTFVSPSVSYLFERRNKRNLRYEVAKEGTAVGIAQLSDSERTLLFNLRSAFVGILQAKAVLRLAQNNIEY